MENIRSAILSYRLKASMFPCKGNIRKAEQAESIQKILSQCENVNMIQDTIIPLLLENGCLLPSDEVLQSSLMITWLEDHYGMNERAMNTKSTGQMPLEVIGEPPGPLLTIWGPVIDLFAKTWNNF